MNENVAIEFKNVTKEYKLYSNDRQRLKAVFFKNAKLPVKKAVNNMSFQIKKGESVAFFGQNGAGKSTLLKMISQVSFPTSGEIKLNGRVSALLELTAGFDVAFTGRENIYFRGQLMGISEEELKRLEPEIVEFAELGEYIDQPVRTYSSGMRARLGFAINANINPEILIVDEALSVGDIVFRRKCNAKIREILADDVTFLFVTHSTGVSRNMCTRGIVVKDGCIMFDGEVNAAADYYESMIAEHHE